MTSTEELLKKHPPKPLFQTKPSYLSSQAQPPPLKSAPSIYTAPLPAPAPAPSPSPSQSYSTQHQQYPPVQQAPQQSYPTQQYQPPQHSHNYPPPHQYPPQYPPQQHYPPQQQYPPQHIPYHQPPQYLQHPPQQIPPQHPPQQHPQQIPPQQIQQIPPQQIPQQQKPPTQPHPPQHPPPQRPPPPKHVLKNPVQPHPPVQQHPPIQQHLPLQQQPLMQHPPLQQPLVQNPPHYPPQQDTGPAIPSKPKIILMKKPAPQNSSISLEKKSIVQTTTTTTATITTTDVPPPISKGTKPISLSKAPPTTTVTVVSLSKMQINEVVTSKELPPANVFLLEAGVPKEKFTGVQVHLIDDGANSKLRFGDSIKIKLANDLPSLQASETSYVLLHDKHMYLIRLSEESSTFTNILREHSGFYEPVVETPKELVGENEYTQKASTASVNIEKGGTAVSQGMIKGAGFIGKGIKGASTVVINNTDKGTREVTEEERRQAELSQQRTTTFLKGTRVVVGGIGKGATFVGQGISKASQKVRGPQEEETTENAQKKAAIGVGGAAANAAGSVVTGFCESAKIIGSDVKDSAVEVKRHREGEDAAMMTEKSMNSAGQVTVGSIHAVGIAATGTVKVAIKVGAAAATYDHDWKKLLDGENWKTGFLSSQDETLGPWVTKWFVLRSYSLAIYKKKKKERYDQILYIPTLSILTVEKVDTRVTKKDLSFKIVTKSGTHFLSVECANKEEKYGKATENDINSWIDAITNLARICDGTIV